MVELPANFILDSTLKLGAVYKFPAPEHITTDLPHYFIVVAIECEDNFLCLCTTQLSKKIAHIQANGYPLETLVEINPSRSNGLTKRSYINCNDSFTIKKNELKNKITSKVLSVAGRISEAEFNSIQDGIRSSRINDIPKHLLINKKWEE